MDDLVTWLRAQLDEDERVARAAIDPKHRGDWAWRKDSRSTVRQRDGVPIGPEARGVEIGPHIARWNPARVLREVEAKRRIVNREAAGSRLKEGAPPHEIEAGPGWQEIRVDGIRVDAEAFVANWFEPITDTPVLRILALPYADRPGYRDEWRP